MDVGGDWLFLLVGLARKGLGSDSPHSGGGLHVVPVHKAGLLLDEAFFSDPAVCKWPKISFKNIYSDLYH